MTDPRHVSSMRITFWPRPGGAPDPADRDLACDNCGYNLRGLRELRCPECGKPFKPRQPSASQIPWKQRHAIGRFEAYIKTVGLVVTDTRRFADEVWRGVRIPSADARSFRLVTVALAYVPLLIVAVTLVGPHLSARQFVPFLVGAAALLGVWLERSTRLPVRFFRRQTMRGDVQKRCVALAQFSCAPLALSGVHLALLAAAGATLKFYGPNGLPFLLVGLAWITFTLLQLAAWLRAVLSLVSQSIQTSELEFLVLTFAFIGVWLLHAVFWLVLLPWSLYLLITRLFGFE